MNIQEFDFSVDIRKVIPWQYDSAPALQSLLTSKEAWYEQNHAQFWRDFYTNIFDLRTANSFGLLIWSIILDLPLFNQGDISPDDYPSFGFADFGLNFDNGNFATDATTTSGITLEQKRQLLRLRYYQLTSDGTVLSINRALADVFGTGQAYVLDGLDMTMTYCFTVSLSGGFYTILRDFDILPRPAGVDINIVYADLLSFGFGDYYLPFDQGNFVGAL